MKTILFILMLSTITFAKSPLKIAHEIEREILSDSREMPKLKKRIDIAMSLAIKIAGKELRKKNYNLLAENLETKWREDYGSTMFQKGRPIGDHPPLNQWLADMYEQIEMVLGRNLCIGTHIAIIKTLNSGVPVVVNPVNFPMGVVSGTREQEYVRHCSGNSLFVDEPYNGVVPEVCWAAGFIACEVLGGTFLCGIVADVGEKLIGTFVTPGLCAKIFNVANGTDDRGKAYIGLSEAISGD